MPSGNLGKGVMSLGNNEMDDFLFCSFFFLFECLGFVAGSKYKHSIGRTYTSFLFRPHSDPCIPISDSLAMSTVGILKRCI